MDSKQRYALADREISVGLVDQDLMNLAIREANGIGVLARQIYLERRSRKMKEEADSGLAADVSVYFNELQAQLEQVERKMVRRNKWEAWTWSAVCFGCMGTSTVFLFFAGAALAHQGARVVRDTLLALLFMIFGIASFIRTKRVENRELMSSR